MTNEEIIEQQNAYYMAGYPSRRSEKEMTKEAKQGYQPIHHKNSSAVPPNVGSNVRMKENGKRIAELEKENTELKTVKIPQLERKIASIRGAHSVDCKKLNARIEQVERLKKENTELRKVNNKLTRKCDCLTECNDGLQDLLDNNIDILEKLIQLQKENAELKEQFLKETENGK